MHHHQSPGSAFRGTSAHDPQDPAGSDQVWLVSKCQWLWAIQSGCGDPNQTVVKHNQGRPPARENESCLVRV